MSHPFVLLAQQRAAQPASTLQGVQDGAREVKRVALDLLPFAAFTMVTAFGRSQKRGDVESVAAGLVAMVGTGIGVAVGRENALQGVLVTAASVATPVALLKDSNVSPLHPHHSKPNSSWGSYFVPPQREHGAASFNLARRQRRSVCGRRSCDASRCSLRSVRENQQQEGQAGHPPQPEH